MYQRVLQVSIAILLSLSLFLGQACHRSTEVKMRMASSDQLVYGKTPAQEISTPFGAWFLGDDKSVHYCFKQSESFGLDPSLVSQLLEESFQTWVDFIKNHHVNGPNRPKSLRLATEFIQDGKCSDNTDLVFYFGLLDSERKVPDVFVRPLAYALRESYDSQSGWSQGYVWVTEPLSVQPDPLNMYQALFPNWSEPFRLKGILLHEIGHILGCEHTHNATIMDEQIFEYLAEPTTNRLKRQLSSISHAQALMDWQEEWTSGPEFQQLGSVQGDAFKILLNRDPIGEVEAVISRSASALILADAQAETKLDLRPINQSRWVQKDRGIFQASLYDPSESQWHIYSEVRSSEITYYSASTPSAEDLILVFQTNPLSLSVVPEFAGQMEMALPLFSPACEWKMLDRLRCVTIDY